MGNLEKWYKLSYSQKRNRDTAIEDKCMDTKLGGVVDGVNLETGINIYIDILLFIKQKTNEHLLYHSGNSTRCSMVT